MEVLFKVLKSAFKKKQYLINLNAKKSTIAKRRKQARSSSRAVVWYPEADKRFSKPSACVAKQTDMATIIDLGTAKDASLYKEAKAQNVFIQSKIVLRTWAVVDLVANLLVYLVGGYAGRVDDFVALELNSYNINSSMVDIFGLSMLRCAAGVVVPCLTLPNLQKKIILALLKFFFGLSIIMNTSKFFLVIGSGDSSSTLQWWQVVLPVISWFFSIAEFWSFLRVLKSYQVLKAIGAKEEVKKTVGKDDVEDPRGRFFDGNREATLTPGLFFKVLRPYFWPRGCKPKLRSMSTFVLLIGSKACNIMAPLFIGAATQQLVTMKEVPWNYLALYFAACFSSRALRELQSAVYLRVKQKAFAEIAEMTFRHLHSLSLDWHLTKKIGHVLRIMDRGISSANSVMNYLVLYLIPSVIECIVTFVIFYTRFKSPQLAVLAFCSFSAYCYVTITITEWRKQFRKKANKYDNKYHDIATDSLVNFETVKYFASEKEEISRFANAIELYQKFTVNTQYSLGLLNSLQQFDIHLTTFFALAIMAHQIINTPNVSPGEKVGEFVSVLQYISQLFGPLSFLGTIYGAVVQAMVDMTNLSELLTMRPDVIDVTGAKRLVMKDGSRGAEIEFKDVTFKYPGETSRGIHGVSFKCKRGTKTAIVGHTGASKTTISRLLFRFYDLASGEITIDGQNISQVTQSSLRHAVGVVPQDTVLFNESIRFNICYGKVCAESAEINAAAKGAHIYDFIVSLSKQWDTEVGERGLKLSGGEKQRVAIARCLLKDPPIVVLDEATSALDSITERTIQDALVNLTKGRTQLVIAHRLSTIQDADQIIVLKNGLVHERGTHDELLALDGEYAASWDAQLKDDVVTEPRSIEVKEEED